MLVRHCVLGGNALFVLLTLDSLLSYIPLLDLYSRVDKQFHLLSYIPLLDLYSRVEKQFHKNVIHHISS
jgi:hypothetical protein